MAVETSLLRVRTLLPRPAAPYFLLKREDPAKGILLALPITPLLTVHRHLLALHGSMFYTFTPHCKGVNVGPPRGYRWSTRAPGTRGFGWEVLCQKTQVNILPQP